MRSEWVHSMCFNSIRWRRRTRRKISVETLHKRMIQKGHLGWPSYKQMSRLKMRQRRQMDKTESTRSKEIRLSKPILLCKNQTCQLRNKISWAVNRTKRILSLSQSLLIIGAFIFNRLLIHQKYKHHRNLSISWIGSTLRNLNKTGIMDDGH